MVSLLAILALFHRPIVFRATKYFVVRFAKEQKLELQYDIGGSIFTTLRVTNLRALPMEPGPIERLEIGTLLLRYSLLGFVRHGWPGLLKEVDLRDVFVVIDPAKTVPREKPVATQKDAKFPALFPDRFNLTNMNFISRSPTGDSEIAGADFAFDSEKSGALKIRTLNIPGIRRWENISAHTTFRDRNLVVSDLTVTPEVLLERIALDVSKLDRQELGVGLEGILFGSRASAAAQVTDLNGTNRLSVQSDLAAMRLDAFSKELDRGLALRGELTRLTFRFEGVPEEPVTWSGTAEVALDGMAVQEQLVGNVSAKLRVSDALASMAFDVHLDANNQVTLSGGFALPRKLDGFAKTNGSGRIALIARDLSAITKLLPQQVTGDLDAKLDFALKDGGKLTAEVTAASSSLGLADAELTRLNLSLHLESNIAGPKELLLKNLATNLQSQATRVRYGQYRADGLALAVATRGPEIVVEKLALAKGTNSAAFRGRYVIPEDFMSWKTAPFSVSVEIAAPDLSAFVAPDSAPLLTGALDIRGHLESANGLHDGTIMIAGKAISYDGLHVRDLGGTLNIANDVAYLPNFSLYLDPRNFANVGGQLSLDGSLKYSAWAEAAFSDLSAFEPLLQKAGEPQALGGAASLSWRGEGEIGANKHAGDITADLVRGKFRDEDGIAAHAAVRYSPERIEVPALRLNTKRGEVRTALHWEDKRLVVEDLTVLQGGRAVLNGTANIALDLFAAQKGLDALVPPDAPLSAALKSTEVDLQPLFKQFGQTAPVIGKVNADLTIEGSRANPVANGRIRGTGLQATSAPGFAPAELALDFGFGGGQLELTTNLQQQKTTLLEGSAEIPLDLAHLENADLLFPDDGRVKISLASHDVDVARWVGQFAVAKPTAKAAPPQKTAKLKKTPKDAAPSLTGIFNTTITAEGTVKDLTANVSVRGTRLQSTAAAKLAPTEVALDLSLRDSLLTLKGSVVQREIKPLTISGEMPLHMAALKKSASLDTRTPISLRIELPRSPLGFGSALVPAIRFIDGTAAIDVKVGGTLGKPEFSGVMSAEIPHLRFRDTSTPQVSGTTVGLDFTRDQISIRQLRGGLGGGSFSAGGSVNMVKFSEPVFDLRVATRDALVLQDDTITARITSDLRITGPLMAGNVTGNVLLTKSRLSKDIDILPIGLPGRPAPQPPAEPAPVSFPKPPLRDWKFDVAIKTSDPFLIQGNLANGRALVDLKLKGTGLHPWVEGSVRIEQLMTSLPYSRLEITAGNIFFTPAKPFVPQLDLRGESLIRDYKITVYVFGDANEPKTIFTSEPPLPQAEIVSLIATGATQKELSGDSNVLAGRAGLLLVQRAYRKLFKKNEPSQPRDTPFKNVQFDVGAPEPHTGQQSVQIRLPLSERFILTGGVDVGGNFRGQIKYLVRFK